MNKLSKARDFCQEVRELAKKYDLEFFLVTEGASVTHHIKCDAVKEARLNHIEWEKKNNFDYKEDWSSEYEDKV